MAITEASLAAKKRIMAASVKLILEKGYCRTTVAEILHDANVSASTFQNIFHAKDGILLELVVFMFENQFDTAKKFAGRNISPVGIYAVETAIQLALTELNDNIRDIYIEAYTRSESIDYIQQHTAKELMAIFSSYQPDYTESDFYEMDIGSCGLMRSYMTRRCDFYFTLENKISRFLTMSLRAYGVPEDELRQVLSFVASLDVRKIAGQVMDDLFSMLAMHFVFPPEDSITA